MSQIGGPPGELRPARPRRPAQDDDAPQNRDSWEIGARLQELHEVVWSIVDTVARLEQGLATAMRELGAMRAGQTAVAHDATAARDTLTSRLDTLVSSVEAVGAAVGSSAAAGREQALRAAVEQEAFRGQLARVPGALAALEGLPAATNALSEGLAEVSRSLTELRADRRILDRIEALARAEEQRAAGVAQHGATVDSGIARLATALAALGEQSTAASADAAEARASLQELRADVAALGEQASALRIEATDSRASLDGLRTAVAELIEATRRDSDRQRRAATREAARLRGELLEAIAAWGTPPEAGEGAEEAEAGEVAEADPEMTPRRRRRRTRPEEG